MKRTVRKRRKALKETERKIRRKEDARGEKQISALPAAECELPQER